MQLAKLFPRKAFFDTDFAQKATGFEPIVFRWCQDGMVPSKPFDKLLLGWLRGSPAEFGENHGMGLEGKVPKF